MTECPCVKKHLTKECSPIYGHCKDGQRQIPLKLLDVAGLIPGASEGAGLGNKVQSGSDMRGSSWMISDMLTFSFTLWMFRDVPTRRERTRWDTTLRGYDLMGRVMNRISTGYTTKFTHGSLTTSTRSGAASFGSTRRTPTATSRRPSRRCFRSVIPLCSHAAAIFRLRNHSRAERGDRALHGSEGAGGPEHVGGGWCVSGE